MSSSSSNDDESMNDDAPARPYKTPEDYISDSCPSSYCYSTEKINSSDDDESEIKFDLNWDLDSSKSIVDKTTGEVNDFVPKVTPVSKKMKSIFRQDFKDPPESIDNKSDSSFNGVVAIARPICTRSTPPMKESTLEEFGFKPRSKMKKKSSSTSTPSVVASTSCSSSAVAKYPDRTDAYEIDDQSFETPPYIKKERAARLERKAKSIAIKKLNKRKKKEETKKEETNEDDEFEKNRIKKRRWAKAVSKRLRLEHEERLRIHRGPPVPGEILTSPPERVSTKNCKHCFSIDGSGKDKCHNKAFGTYILTMVSWKFQQKKMSFNMNDIKKEVLEAYNQKLRVETMNATGGFLAYRYSSPPLCVLNGVFIQALQMVESERRNYIIKQHFIVGVNHKKEE
jgi:hypothetical protein